MNQVHILDELISVRVFEEVFFVSQLLQVTLDHGKIIVDHQSLKRR